MAFKLKHTNVQNMLGKEPSEGPKMYKEERPAMYADETSGGPKAMDEMHNGKPGVQQEDFKQFSKGAKSMGPKGHVKGHETTQVYENMHENTYLKRQAKKNNQ